MSQSKASPKPARPTIKLVESNRQISSGSHLDRYWNNKGFDDLLSRIRPGANRTQRLEAVMNFEKMIEMYHLHAIGFGNWVTQEDRFNYQSALYFSLSDMQSVVQFPSNNIGLFESLAITFGARGVPRALAHYEPFSDIINISRYDDGEESKNIRFLSTGGMGSFAHEYGHFLDYWFGKFAESGQTSSLTFGCSIAGSTFRNTYKESKPLRYKMNRLIESIIWIDPDKKIHSPYYKLLYRNTANVAGGYFLRHNEIFARAFEVYVFYHLNLKGINNRFMTKGKYERIVYLSPKEFARVKPKMEDLIKEMRLTLKVH